MPKGSDGVDLSNPTDPTPRKKSFTEKSRGLFSKRQVETVVPVADLEEENVQEEQVEAHTGHAEKVEAQEEKTEHEEKLVHEEDDYGDEEFEEDVEHQLAACTGDLEVTKTLVGVLVRKPEQKETEKEEKEEHNNAGRARDSETKFTADSGGVIKFGGEIRASVAYEVMVNAREQLTQDLEDFAVDPSEDAAQKCRESTQNVIEAWIKTKGHVEAAAAALQESAKEGDMIGSVESAINFAKLARAILVGLRTSVATLTKKKSMLARKGKVTRKLQSALEEALQQLKGEAVALKKRLASDPEAIRILMDARENLVRECKAFVASPGEEAWKGCTAQLGMLVDSWTAVRRAIVAAVEELRGKARDTDLIGGTKSAVVLARLLRGAVSELLVLMKALGEMKEEVQGIKEGATKAVAEAALKKARGEMKAIRTVLMDTSAEQILEGAELQQLRAEAAVDEGDAMLDYAEMLVHGLSMIPIPGVQSVCEMMNRTIGAARNAHTLASDALEMTESVIEIGRNMRYMKRLANSMDEEAKEELESEMGKLAMLLNEMKDAIETFGQKGYVRKMFTATKVVRRLASMERRKEVILKAMDRTVQRVQTELMLMLNTKDRVKLETKEHVYALEEAVCAKVEERTKANGGDVDVEADVSKAAEEIMRDPDALQEVADSAGLSEEVFKEEMSLIHEELEGIKIAVQEEGEHIREDNRQAMAERDLRNADADVVAAKARRDHLLQQQLLVDATTQARPDSSGDRNDRNNRRSSSSNDSKRDDGDSNGGNGNGKSGVTPQVASMVDLMVAEERVQLAEKWKEYLRHDETHPLLKKGREHYKAKNFEEAISCFNQVIKADEDSRAPHELKQAKRLAMMAHIQIATGLLLQKQYEKAMLHFKHALGFHEGSDKRMKLVREYHACCLYELGKEAFENGDWGRAEELLEKAVETKALPSTKYKTKAKAWKKQCILACREAKKACRLDGGTEDIIALDSSIRDSKAFALYVQGKNHLQCMNLKLARQRFREAKKEGIRHVQLGDRIDEYMDKIEECLDRDTEVGDSTQTCSIEGRSQLVLPNKTQGAFGTGSLHQGTGSLHLKGSTSHIIGRHGEQQGISREMVAVIKKDFPRGKARMKLTALLTADLREALNIIYATVRIVDIVGMHSGSPFERAADFYDFSRSLGDTATQQDIASGVPSLAGLQVNETAIVNRSDGRWTYAKLLKVSDEGMQFLLDSKGAKKMYSADWYSLVRRLPVRGDMPVSNANVQGEGPQLEGCYEESKGAAPVVETDPLDLCTITFQFVQHREKEEGVCLLEDEYLRQVGDKESRLYMEGRSVTHLIDAPRTLELTTQIDGTKSAEGTLSFVDNDGDHIKFAVEGSNLIKYANGRKHAGKDDSTGIVTELTIKCGSPYEVRDQDSWGSIDYPEHVVAWLWSVAQEAQVKMHDYCGSKALAPAQRREYIVGTTVSMMDIECTLEKQLGAGASAAVFEVLFGVEGQIFPTSALKVFHTRSGFKQLCSEASIMLDLSWPKPHPNVLQVEFVWYEHRFSDILFLTELVDGGTLQDWINDERLYIGSVKEQQERLMSVAHQLALGLQHLHERGILHQDIKPENVLMTKEGRLVLADFSISAKGTCEGGCVQAKLMGATLPFASPNHTRLFHEAKASGGHEPVSISQLDDIWGMAATILDTFAECGWRAGRTVAGLVHGRAKGAAASLKDVQMRVEMPAPMKQLVCQCFDAGNDGDDSKLIMSTVLQQIESLVGSKQPVPARETSIMDGTRYSIIHSNLGLALQSRRQHADAQEQFKRAMEADPGQTQTIKMRATNEAGEGLESYGKEAREACVQELRKGVQVRLQRVLGVDHPIGCCVDIKDDGLVTVSIVRASLWDQMTQTAVLSDVGFLQCLRDEVLGGTFETGFSITFATTAFNPHEDIPKRGRKKRAGTSAAKLSMTVDKNAFLEMYELNMLMLRTMTQHQQKKYNECIEPGEVVPLQDTLVHGPAGSGKTFVGIHVLHHAVSSDEGTHVLFMAPNGPLAYFTAKWLLLRMDGDVTILSRVHVLCGASMDRKCFVLDDGLLTMEAVDESAQIGYSLVVVDEAHHLDYARAAAQINKYTKDADAPRLLLSDVSQSTSTADTWSSTLLSRGGERGSMVMAQPPKTIVLSQVVRSTQRLVAGAWAFDTSGKLAKCHHNSVGPALQAFLFEASTERRIAVYAEKVLEALRSLLATYPGLNLSDRVGIITPSEAFAMQLQALLKQVVTNFEGRSFGFVSAAEASRRVAATTCENEQRLVLDTVDNFNGLERLIVMAVDLDSPIGQGTAAQTRSHLYRAMTRAQMMVVVVNVVVKGGWLEFLMRVEFDKEGEFDVEGETKKNVKGGARGVVVQDAAEAKRTPQGEQKVDEWGQRGGQQKEGVGPVGPVRGGSEGGQQKEGVGPVGPVSRASSASRDTVGAMASRVRLASRVTMSTMDSRDSERLQDELSVFYSQHDPDRSSKNDEHVFQLLSNYTIENIAGSLQSKYGRVPSGWELFLPAETQQNHGARKHSAPETAWGRTQHQSTEAERRVKGVEKAKEDCVTSMVWDTSMNTVAGIESTPIASLKFMPLREGEWWVLAELRDATNFTNWSAHKDDWGTLEKHRDPSQCAGVTVQSGEITRINLSRSNLMGGESHVHPKSRTGATSDIHCVCSTTRVHW
jgi:tetratricopeptide (TPR) repeat protein